MISRGLRQMIGDDEEELIDPHAGMGDPDAPPDIPELPEGLPDWESMPDLVDNTDIAPRMDDSMPTPRAERQPQPTRAAAAAGGKTWSPDVMGAIAAFTKNPAMMEFIRNRRAEPDRELARKRLATQDARQATMDQLAIDKGGRDAERFAAEKPYIADTAQAGIESKKKYAAGKDQLMQERALDSDPDSDRSKKVATASADSLLAQIQVLEAKGGADPKLLDMMKRTAEQMRGMSASEIKSVFKNSPLLKVVPQALGEAQRTFQNAMDKDGSARGWYSAQNSVRQGDERIDLQRQEVEQKDAGKQEKLNTAIESLAVTEAQMKEAMSLKGNVNTGPMLQGVRDMFGMDKWDALSSEDRTRLKALGARVFNKETHEISGAAVTPSEWLRIEPQIPEMSDDDAVYSRKMAEAMRITGEILASRRREYQLKQDGRPKDRSTTAKQQVAKMPGADPNAAAKDWLAKNPDDPRAAAIRKKLGL